jgi:hypothetical protein
VQILGEGATADDHQRQGANRSEQAAQQAGAPLDIELAKRARDDGGYRRELHGGRRGVCRPAAPAR